MAKEKKKVPNLRFKGFTDDWEQHKLEEIAEFYNGDRGPNYPKPSEIVEQGVPFINAGDLINGHIDYRNCKHITSDKFNQLNGAKLKINDIVYCLRGTIGKNGLVNSDANATIASSLVCIRPVKLRPLFLFQILNSSIEERQRKMVDEGAAQPNISATNLKKFLIPVPNDNEQEKIGEVFSKLNHLITLQQRKLDLLKQLKKGMLQKMFADKDSKRPVLRFEGFNDDWERRKLGDLVVIKSGLSTNTQSRQGFYKITRIETISKGLIDMNKTGSVQIKPDDKYLMHAGDILFSNINSLKHIGKVAIFNGKSTLYHGMNLLRMTAQSNVSSYFIYYQLITDKHSNWAKAHANPAVSQASINQHTLSLEPMYITKLEEQHEISDFIGKLDSILTFQQQKLVRINKIKKSLLQQIFI